MWNCSRKKRGKEEENLRVEKRGRRGKWVVEKKWERMTKDGCEIKKRNKRRSKKHERLLFISFFGTFLLLLLLR
jgi:hypothetical protein